eukprot:Skav225060  [mRNA]  locus=scaffold2293:13302:13640:- [translate_table: standard]
MACSCSGQRLQIMVPIIMKKLERLGGPDSVKVLKLLQDYVAPSSVDWQKKARQVKIQRALERMNTSALFDLGSDLFASDVLEALHELRQNHFSFQDEDPDAGDDGRLTLFSL